VEVPDEAAYAAAAAASRPRNCGPYFGCLMNLGTESYRALDQRWWNGLGLAYTRHEFEYRVLCLLEKGRNLDQTLHHRIVVSNGASHASGQLRSQSMVDVEFIRRTGCEESIVQACGISKGTASSDRTTNHKQQQGFHESSQSCSHP